MQPTSAPSGHLLPEEGGSSGIRASTIYIQGAERCTAISHFSFLISHFSFLIFTPPLEPIPF